jgi:hypothetical protein
MEWRDLERDREREKGFSVSGLLRDRQTPMTSFSVLLVTPILNPSDGSIGDGVLAKQRKKLLEFVSL